MTACTNAFEFGSLSRHGPASTYGVASPRGDSGESGTDSVQRVGSERAVCPWMVTEVGMSVGAGPLAGEVSVPTSTTKKPANSLNGMKVLPPLWRGCAQR